MSNRKGPFDKIEQNSNIKQADIYKIANSVKNADFSDEKTVRNLVQHLSRMANKRISKDKEDKIVQTIIQNKLPTDMQSLSKFFK
ncbi:stage VI sporulation protein F [Virgibacillus sp. W0430]|uniref:stage VI sporulation protein F n=1 Tax=Virgibacillus sp. W0430 TaxID=3391580 RepID=UPI003F44FF61